MPRTLLPALTLAAVTAGCGRSPSEPPSAARDVLAHVSWQSAPTGSDDLVLASVDGRPVFASDVRALARARGLDRDAALAAAIDAEVLVGAARAAGLGPGAEVRRVLRQHMVHRFVAREFERQHTPAALPDAALRTLYERNKEMFVHPRAVQILYLTFRSGPRTGLTEEAAEKAQADLVIYLERVLAPLQGGEQRLARFREIAEEKRWKERGIGLYSLVVDSGASAWAATLDLRVPGQLSRPLRTDMGFAVAMLDKDFPARNDSFESVRLQLHARYYERWLTESFQTFTDQLTKRAGAVVDDDALRSLFLGN